MCKELPKRCVPLPDVLPVPSELSKNLIRRLPACTDFLDERLLYGEKANKLILFSLGKVRQGKLLNSRLNCSQMSGYNACDLADDVIC